MGKTNILQGCIVLVKTCVTPSVKCLGNAESCSDMSDLHDSEEAV